MLNQNLVNISPVDVELCEIRNDSVDSAKSEILPSMVNFVIVELNNLEELINDSAYLTDKFCCNAFGREIRYGNNKFYVYGFGNLIKLNPNDIIPSNFKKIRDFDKGHRQFYLESNLDKFCQYVEDFKANYLDYMKDVKLSQERILEKIGCDSE